MDNSEDKIVSAYADYIINNNYLGQVARRYGLSKNDLFKSIIDNGLLFKSKIVETEPSAFLMDDRYIELDRHLDYRDTYVGMELIELLKCDLSLDELKDAVKEILAERESYYEQFNHVIWRGL